MYYKTQKRRYFGKKNSGKHKNLLLSIPLFLWGLNLWSQEVPIADSLSKTRLNDVEIKWIRPGGEIPFSGTYVNGEQIGKQAGNGSINNLFDNIPSMTVSSDAGNGIGGTTMSVRGIDHTRINVTLNGIELNDAESQGAWFVNLPNLASYTQSLTLQRGVGASTNGAAAFGGSINFSTWESDEQKPFLEISSTAGSFYTFKNSVAAGTGLISNRLSATVFYSNLQSRGYLERATANLNSVYFTAQYKLLNFKKGKDYGTLRVNIIHGAEKTGLAWDGTDAEKLKENRRYNPCGVYLDKNGDERFYSNETDNYQQTHSQLFYSYKKLRERKEKIIHVYNLDIGLHLTRGIGYYEQYKAGKKYSAYDITPIRDTATGKELKKDLITRKYLDNYFYGIVFNFSDDILFNRKKPQKLKWSVGGALNNYAGTHYGKIIWTEYAADILPDYQWYHNLSDKIQSNIYGKIEYSPINRLMLYGDIQYRYIYYKMKGIEDKLRDISGTHEWKNFFNPKVGIHLYLDKQLRHSIYYSFAMSHREPTRSDLVEAPVDRIPVAETLYDNELGYSMQLKKFALNVNLYYMYYQNQLTLTGELNDVGKSMMVNVDKSYRAGAELVASFRPAKFFIWKINGTFSMNKILGFTNYIENYDTGDYIEQYLGTTDISFSPNIIAGNEFLFTPIKNFDISLQTKFVSRQYLDNSSNKDLVLKPYTFTNLQLSYVIETRPIRAIRLFFSINNLFNMQYESNGYSYQYYENGMVFQSIAYNPQAGINFMGGISLKF